MSSWFNIQIGKHKAKYQVLNEEEKDFPYCNSEGEELRKISGKLEKGHFEDNTGKTYSYNEVFRKINGKVSKGFEGRIKEIAEDKIKYTPVDEAEDLLTSKTGIMICDELYKELSEKQVAIKTAVYLSRGYKAYKTFIYPSKLYKGVLIVKMGNSQISDRITEEMKQLEDIKNLKARLSQIELTTQAVEHTKIEDLIEI